MSSRAAFLVLVLQVCLQGPSGDRLLRSPCPLRRLPDVRRRSPGHVPLLRVPAPGHHPPAAKPRLVLLRPAPLGASPSPVGTAHRPAHPGAHDQVADGGGRGRDVSSRLPGEVGAPHLQTRRPTDQDRHAQKALPGVGRALRRPAPAEDYKHPAVHHTGRCGHPLP